MRQKQTTCHVAVDWSLHATCRNSWHVADSDCLTLRNLTVICGSNLEDFAVVRACVQTLKSLFTKTRKYAAACIKLGTFQVPSFSFFVELYICIDSLRAYLFSIIVITMVAPGWLQFHVVRWSVWHIINYLPPNKDWKKSRKKCREYGAHDSPRAMIDQFFQVFLHLSK